MRPGQGVVCPLCQAPIQRTERGSAYGAGGTIQEGLDAHYRVVHPGQESPRVR